MQPKAINPFNAAGQKHKDALDFIIANLPSTPTFENLNEVVVNSVFTPDPLSPMISDLAVLFLGTVLPFAYNGYVNRGLVNYTKYTDNQLVIIHQLLDGIKSVPAESIGEFISSIDENIAASKLSYEEQSSLFITTASAKSDFEYWVAQIETPGIWTTYLNADKAINYMHLPGWVSASVQGALLSYGLVKPPQLQPLDVFSAYVGSVGLAAGKVVMGWLGK